MVIKKDGFHNEEGDVKIGWKLILANLVVVAILFLLVGGGLFLLSKKSTDSNGGKEEDQKIQEEVENNVVSKSVDNGYVKEYKHIYLKKKDVSGQKTVLDISPFEGNDSIEKWGDFIYYTDAKKIIRYDLKNGEVKTVLDSKDNLQILEGMKSWGAICDLKAVDDYIYFDTCGYMVNGSVFYASLPDLNNVQRIYSGQNLSADIFKSHDRYFARADFGDAGVVIEQYGLLDTKKKTVNNIGKINMNMGIGDAFLGNDADYLFGASFAQSLERESTPGNFFVMLTSLYGISIDNPFVKKDVLPQYMMPEEIWFVDYIDSNGMFILYGYKGDYIFDPQKGVLNKLIDSPEEFQNPTEQENWVISSPVFYSEDGKNIFSYNGKSVYAYDVATEKSKLLFDLPKEFEGFSRSDKIRRLVYSREEGLFLAVGDHVYLYESKTGQSKKILDFPEKDLSFESKNLNIYSVSVYDEFACFNVGSSDRKSTALMSLNTKTYKFNRLKQQSCTSDYFFELKKTLEKQELPGGYSWVFGDDENN